jgi:segregation and condensation protein A
VNDGTETAPTGTDLVPWDDPSRLSEAGTAPILSADGFEGPLDWLLEMVRAQKIDLARLSIASLIDSFCTALDVALAASNGDSIQLGRWGDWLVMAANLALLRSRLLLPADPFEARAAEQQAEALRRQLVNRAQVAAAADWLERRNQLGHDIFTRGRPETGLADRTGDITELLRACLVVLQVPEEQVVTYRPRPPPLWTVDDAMTRMRELLPGLADGAPLAVFLPEIDHKGPTWELRCRAAVASTLVAGLEMAKTGDLHLDQETFWMPIHLQRAVAQWSFDAGNGRPYNASVSPGGNEVYAGKDSESS